MPYGYKLQFVTWPNGYDIRYIDKSKNITYILEVATSTNLATKMKMYTLVGSTATNIWKIYQ